MGQKSEKYIFGVKNIRTIRQGSKGNDKIERVEDYVTLNHPIVVEFTKQLSLRYTSLEIVVTIGWRIITLRRNVNNNFAEEETRTWLKWGWLISILIRIASTTLSTTRIPIRSWRKQTRKTQGNIL